MDLRNPNSPLPGTLSHREREFTLKTIHEGSPFLSELLNGHPDYLDWLTLEVFGDRIKDRPSFLADARAAIDAEGISQGRIRALHQVHRKELLRIGARDLSGRVSMQDVTYEISGLADAVIQIAFEEAWRETVDRLGETENRFGIIGLGKLGGEELNFSSDVDIIYVFSDERFSQFSTKLARRITQILTEHTSEGSFYRVDLRLRPEGSRGAIALPIRALQTYYDSWGETFERLALTKARVVAGHADVGEQFLNLIEPFVYRKYLDYAAIDEIRDIKHRIDQQVERSVGLERHVKLGRGGIREVEFFVQALQLLYGGEIEEIRVRNTLTALERLEEAHLIERAVARRLRESYIFLRNLEHKLQIVHQLQTHELPEDRTELEQCARRMRMTLPAFQSALDEHRDAVHKTFRELFAGRTRVDEGVAGAVHRFLNHAMSDEATREWLVSIGFEDPVQSSHNLALLRDAPAFGHSPTRMKNLLANILTPLIESAATSIRPDTVLNRFERLTASTGAREAFFKSLLENPRSIFRLARLLALSEYLSEILFASPEVLDFLIDDQRLQRPIRYPDEAGDPRLQEFYAACQYFFGVLTRRRTARVLTRIAERELRKALPASQPIAIFGVGKLGEREMNFRSDLDVIAFYDGNYEKSLRTIEEWVQTLSPAFKLDLRLRPEGKKGALIWSPARYAEYLSGRGETWERMALTKARFVAGDRVLGERIIQIIQSFVYERPFGQEQVEEMNLIRLRMEKELARESDVEWDLKVGRGGIVDIEFLVEYQQIPANVRIPSTIAAMKCLGVAEELLEYYEFLRNVESGLRLWSPLASTRIEPKDHRALAVMLNVEEFAAEYRRVTGRVREIYDTKKSGVRSQEPE